MEFRIVTSRDYEKFQCMIEIALKKNWILHGYTQHPLEIIFIGKTPKTAGRGQWSQAFIRKLEVTS